ncbi:MAG: 50S ribosomal protein L11 methyltransferase [Myxococcota bacterium]
MRQTRPITVALDLGAPLEGRSFDAVADALFVAGAVEVGDSTPRGLVASFPARMTARQAVSRAVDTLSERGVEVVSARLLDSPTPDWSEHWRREFRPIQVGPLWVVPAWRSPPPGAELVLELDPGLAFGTGAHATSAMCLEWLVARAARGPIQSFLDLGTGSGILALSALLIGVGRAVGADIDPDAVSTARENAAHNGLSAELELRGEDWLRAGETFELIIANLTTIPLLEEADRILSALGLRGTLVLSGILEEELEEVARAYVERGLTIVDVALRGGWARIELVRPQ